MSEAAYPTIPDADRLLGHLSFIRGLARDLVRDPHLAEDLSQNTVLAALSGRPAPVDALEGWLGGTVRNLVRVRARGESRRLARERVVARRGGDAVHVVEDALERSELRRELVEAVLGLPVRSRTAIVLRYIEEMPPRQIARVLDLPLNTVRAQLRRGLAELRDHFDRRHGGDRGAWVIAVGGLASAPGFRQIGRAACGVIASGAMVAIVAAGLLVVATHLGDDSVSPPLLSRPGESLANESDSDRVRRNQVESRTDARSAPTDAVDPDARAENRDVKSGPSHSARRVDAPVTARGVEFLVVDRESGRPLPGAEIRLRRAARFGPSRIGGSFGFAAIDPTAEAPPEPEHHRTNSQGRARVELDSTEDVEIMLTRSGHVGLGWHRVSLTPGVPFRIDLRPAGRLRLTRSAVVSGRLSISIASIDGPKPGTSSTVEIGADQGEVEIDTLSPGRYAVCAWSRDAAAAPYGAQLFARVVDVSADNQTLELFTADGVDAAVEVSGSGSDENLRVELLRHGHLSGLARRSGTSFRFRSLAPGKHTLVVREKGRVLSKREVVVSASASEPSPVWKVRIVRPRLRVFVLGAVEIMGSPSVWIEDLRDVSQTRIPHRAADGSYEFRSPPPGAYRLWVRSGSSLSSRRIEICEESQEIRVDVRNGSRHRLRVRAFRDGAIEGRVIITTPGGHPVGEKLLPAGVDAQSGPLWLLPTGKYFVAIEPNEGLPDTQAVDLESDCRLEIELPREEGCRLRLRHGGRLLRRETIRVAEVGCDPLAGHLHLSDDRGEIVLRLKAGRSYSVAAEDGKSATFDVRRGIGLIPVELH